MPRKPDPTRRQDLEDAAVEYVLANGVSDLTLRPLAKALGVSTYSLAYHFGSKEGLIIAVMERIEQRQRDLAEQWLREGHVITPAAVMRKYWEQWCLPAEFAPYHRLFFEVYARSLQQPERFAGFFERGPVPWLPFLRSLFADADMAPAEVDVLVWLMVSSILGALLGLLATGDKEGTSRAVNAVADFVDARTLPPRRPSSPAPS